VGEGFCARMDKVAFVKTKAIIIYRKDFLKLNDFDFFLIECLLQTRTHQYPQ